MVLGSINWGDIYLLRWTKLNVIILIICLIIWLWRVDRDMKERNGEGLFERMFEE